MRRRSIRNPELNACPMCRKVVEYGMQCEACASWFHATEQCCGDALANAFTTTGRDAWTCLNCFPQQGVAPAADTSKKHAATIDHLDWRRAFRILTDSCAGCGLKVRVCRRRAAPFFSRKKIRIDAYCIVLSLARRSARRAWRCAARRVASPTTRVRVAPATMRRSSRGASPSIARLRATARRMRLRREERMAGMA